MHLVLVHEAVAGTPPKPESPSDEDDDAYDEWNDRIAREYFGDMDPALQTGVAALLERHNVTITTYKTNAEASLLAAAFVDDLQDNLIFRLYVPAGRIYEDELSRLLEIFHHWLGAVKKTNVRQSGYKTAHGRVIEFFGEAGATNISFSDKLSEFNAFLGVLDDSAAASAMLIGIGVETSRAEELVTRYSKEARRVLVDARHERDRRILAIQHQIESELIDEQLPMSVDALASVVQALVPMPSRSLGIAGPTSPSAAELAGPAVAISNTTNIQYVARVEGIVAQNLEGGVHLGPPVDALLALIRSSDDMQKLALEDAAKQLADPQAPTATRISARQRLKDFLLRNAARVEAKGFNEIWDWLSEQISG